MLIPYVIQTAGGILRQGGAGEWNNHLLINEHLMFCSASVSFLIQFKKRYIVNNHAKCGYFFVG